MDFIRCCTTSTSTTTIDVVTPSGHNDNSMTHTVNVNTIPNNSTSSMNEENKKALKILIEKGGDDAVKYMLNPTEDKPLSYAEMRERFG